MVYIYVCHFYRFFLKRFSLISQTDQDEHASTIKAKLAVMGSSLNNFERLHVKNGRFIGNRRKRHETDEEIGFIGNRRNEEISVINWPWNRLVDQ